MNKLLRQGLGGLTGLACALCCAIPLLLAAGVLGAGWAFLGQVMPGVALALAGLTALAFWSARSRRAAAHATGCAGGNCSCGTGTGTAA